MIPRGMSEKHVEPGDRIVAIGGRTGRDGIHGATFSSAELTGESETVSGGAVQIGNAITEKMVLDVVLQARDRGLFRSITDCGAGGFSSAVGEMGEHLGAEVDLDRAPLKYEGLSYTEIWISEAQERMVLAVPPENWPELQALCDGEQVEATDLGQFVATGRLTLRYHGEIVGRPVDGLPPRRPSPRRPGRDLHPGRPSGRSPCPRASHDYTADLLGAARRPGTSAARSGSSASTTTRSRRGRSSSRWSGVADDGPGDASVVLPVRGSTRGAWRSPAGSTRGTAGSTPTRWPAA